MSFETYVQCFNFIASGALVSLGSGEPTLHPKLFEMIDYGRKQGCRMHLVTNGKRTNVALKLADMASEGFISCHLSLDQWHEPIDPAVVQSFKRDRRNLKDKRAYRRAFVEDLKSHGRCDFGNPLKNNACACVQRIVKHDGRVMFCGCDTAVVVGSVSSGIDRSKIRDKLASGCHRYRNGLQAEKDPGGGVGRINRAFRLGDTHADPESGG